MLDQILITGFFLWLIYGLVFTEWPAVWTFSCAMLACYFFGLVDSEDLLQKASNPGLITLVLLLLVSQGLEKLNWIKDLSGKLISSNYTLSLLRVGVVTAGFSAVINNTAVVATLANTVRNNTHHPASKLLIPLSYAAILGGTTTLIGTSTNLIVSGFLEDATGQGLAFFDFFAVGASATALGIVAMLLSSKLLPSHPVGRVEVDQYLIETEVLPGSLLVGKSVVANKLREMKSLFLVEISRGDYLISPVGPQEVIEEGDKLIFSGDIGRLDALDEFDGLSLYAVDEGLLRQNLTEVIVMPNATVEGKTIKDVGFRSLFDAAVVGLHRGGKRLSGKLGDITIHAGDNLMLAAGPDFVHRKNLKKNFLVTNDEIGARLSPVENYFISISLIAVVSLSILNVVPLMKGLAFILVGMLILGTVKGAELRRRFPFELFLIIASALVFAQALTNTGLTSLIADSFHGYLSSLGPYTAIAGIFFVTLLLTEVMTNNAAAALSFPIAFGLAESFGLSHMPFIMAVAYGASASFLTPYGYTTNLMVQNLGGYSFRDYLRAGLPMSIVYSICVIILIPVIFPFEVG